MRIETFDSPRCSAFWPLWYAPCNRLTPSDRNSQTKEYTMRTMSLLSLLVLFLSACGLPPQSSSSEERQFLTDGASKTWRMTKVVITGKQQTLSPGILALTRTYTADGSWVDNLGSHGVWSINYDRYDLQEKTLILSPFVTNGKPETRSVRIISLRPKMMILEFDNLDIGTGDKGHGKIYLEPTPR